jgi:lipid-A-disaccharide synthase
MARHVDHVLALLPFEPPYMQAAGMTCDFVGHPVAARPVATPDEIAVIRADLGIGADQRLMLALPGSRRGEVSRHAPVFAEVIRRLRAGAPDLAVVVPAAGAVADLTRSLLPPDADGWPRVLDPTGADPALADARKRAIFATADAALAASGTVSLELAAAGTPMVIAYAANPFSAFLAKRLVRIDTVTLVNLVTDTRTIPEFLLENCTPALITPALRALLDDPDIAAAQRAAGSRAMDLLGRGADPPGLRAARSVLAHLGAGKPSA